MTQYVLVLIALLFTTPVQAQEPDPILITSLEQAELILQDSEASFEVKMAAIDYLTQEPVMVNQVTLPASIPDVRAALRQPKNRMGSCNSLMWRASALEVTFKMEQSRVAWQKTRFCQNGVLARRTVLQLQAEVLRLDRRRSTWQRFAHHFSTSEEAITPE